jgi:hypothetical protein
MVTLKERVDSEMDKLEPYIELSDGHRWYPDRDGQDFYPETVARSLSKLCRFTGHCDRFYSVAEHCVKVSHMVPDEFAYEALLHDAHEMLVNDLSKPVKIKIGGSYEELEDKAEIEVRRSFGLSDKISDEVKLADVYMVCIEGYYLMKSRGLNWDYYDDYRETALIKANDLGYLVPHCWDHERAEIEWLQRFYEVKLWER